MAGRSTSGGVYYNGKHYASEAAAQAAIQGEQVGTHQHVTTQPTGQQVSATEPNTPLPMPSLEVPHPGVDMGGGSLAGLRVPPTASATNVGGGPSMDDQRSMLQLQAKIQADAEARRAGMLPGILKSAQPGHVNYGSADGEDARAAAFARAKDKAGQTARASLNALYDATASMGQAGSGQETAAARDIIGGARGDINDFTREQMIQDLDANTHAQDQEYQGGIAQRAQDLGLTPSLLALIGQRAY